MIWTSMVYCKKNEGRYLSRFERAYSLAIEDVFGKIINPDCFVQWYPFATGEMDVRIGGKIYFDDGEGAKYEAVITELEPPYVFGFRHWRK